jgi:nucleolar protein 12
MSLMKSIFGGEASSPKKDDLFHSPVIPPKVVASAPKNKSNESAETEVDAGQQSTPSASDTAKKTHATRSSKEVDKLEEERTIFVGNLPPDISRKALSSIFKECGKVSSSRLRSLAVAGVKLPPNQVGNQNLMRKVCANTGKLLDTSGKKTAQGYVVFESVDSVEAALKLNNTNYEGYTIRVDHASPTIDSTHSVFVGNLPYGAEEETLRSHFLDALKADDESIVTGVRIIRDKETQQCKGFGYVTFLDASYVPLALELHNTTYMKREIRVMISGKRFKGKKGDEPKKRFEGQRATTTVATTAKKKRKLSEGTTAAPSAGKPKRRKARSDKNPAAKSGLSKRAVTEQKVNKRVKKLEKRAAKGMGKKKH